MVIPPLLHHQTIEDFQQFLILLGGKIGHGNGPCILYTTGMAHILACNGSCVVCVLAQKWLDNSLVCVCV